MDNMSIKLFEISLGIQSPLFIERVELNEGDAGKELHVFLDFEKGARFLCPKCGAENCIVCDTQEKIWRHVNFFQYKCFLHLRTPIVRCECGRHIYRPFWERDGGSAFTVLFEAFVIELIGGGMTFLAAEKILGEYDNRLFRIVSHYVEKAYAAKDFSEINSISIDETSSKTGHNYVTVVSSHEKGEVIFVTEGKGKETVAEFIGELPKHGADAGQILEATMDMSGAYIAAVTEFMPWTDITFDRFHVQKLLNESVDKIRREESKEDKELKQLLKNSRYLWLKNPNSLTAKQTVKIGELEKCNLKTAEAYRLKLLFQDIYNCADSPEEAAGLLANWGTLALSTGLKPLEQFVNTLQNHAEGVLNYFKNKRTSGISEGLNSVIQSIKRQARGFHNMHNFCIMIYLRLAKLGLYRFLGYP